MANGKKYMMHESSAAVLLPLSSCVIKMQGEVRWTQQVRHNEKTQNYSKNTPKKKLFTKSIIIVIVAELRFFINTKEYIRGRDL